MADHIHEDGRHVGYIEHGFAFDQDGRKRYRVEGEKLHDVETGQVVGYLTAAGKQGTVSKTGLFD